MKVLRPGTLQEAPPNWWVGRKQACHKCHAIMILEEGDEVSVLPARRVDEISMVQFTCPTPNCGTVLEDGFTWSQPHGIGQMAPWYTMDQAKTSPPKTALLARFG